MFRVSILIAAACAAIVSSTVAAQQRFTSHAEAVRVDVLVTNGDRLVSGLTADDFEIRDSGVFQRVALIEVERLPLNVMLVLDTSGSVAGQRLQQLVEACRALVRELRQPDRVALLSFANRVRTLAPLTRDRDAILTVLNGLKGNGSTPLRDAAFAALALREGDPGRTLMVLFSDGADTSSWLTAAKVIETAKRSDVVVYPVGLGKRITYRLERPGEVADRVRLQPGRSPTLTARRPVMPADVQQAGQFLNDLADATGGRVMLAGGSSDLRATFLATLAEFRDRYVLSYEPNGVPADGWHAIEVRLTNKKGKVTARRGYFAQ